MTTKTRARPRATPAAGRCDEMPDTCLFCHRSSDVVEFVVIDREHCYNVCAACLDDSAKAVACMSVC